MKQNDLEHLSGYIAEKDIGLKWLHAVTCLQTVAAVQTHPHAHRYDELLLCLRGEFNYDIDGIGETTMAAGTGMLMPAGSMHSLKNDIDAPGERISLFLKRRSSGGPGFAVFSPSDYRRLHSRLKESAGRPFQIPRSEIEHIKKLSEFSRLNEKRTSSLKLAQIRIMVCSVFLEVALRSDEVPRTPQIIEAAITYLKEHMSENIDIEALVKHIGYGRARFFDLFRERYRMSPMQCLTRLRMKKARELLASTDLPVNEIARKTGFDDAAYFSAVFRRNCAMTPTKWRKLRGFGV